MESALGGGVVDQSLRDLDPLRALLACEPVALGEETFVNRGVLKG
jgi:hypothetical protein